jgi:integrase/recombinase XerD
MEISTPTKISVSQVDLVKAAETFFRLGLSGKSAGTKAWYSKRIVPLINHLGRDKPVSSILDIDIREWYIEMENQSFKWGGSSSHPVAKGGYSPSYLHSLVRACKYFFGWLMKKGIIEDDPSSNLALPRLPKTGRKGISDRNAKKILAIAKAGTGDDLQVRNYAILRFLESTGARLGGIASLTLDSLSIEDNEPLCRRAIVFEKGEKSRSVFMTPKALEAVKAWLNERPDIDSDFVFLGKKNGTWSPLSKNGIYQIIKRHAQASGVDKNWSPHQWRHRLGRKLAQNGMSLGMISQIMGHADVAITVNYYGGFAVGELQSAYDRYWNDLN